MATFKVGQRVRINRPGVMAHGREGLIWKISNDIPWSKTALNDGKVSATDTGHFVDIDGIGRRWHDSGAYIAFAAHQLEPIVDSDGYESFMERVLKPIDQKLLTPLDHDAPKMPRRKHETIRVGK